MYDVLVSKPEILIALFALVTSIVSIVIAVQSLKHQQQHNKLSFVPIPEISIADYEDSLRVRLKNNGTGPLFIKKFTVFRKEKNEGSVIAMMGTLPNKRTWSHFATDLENRAILPGKSIPLLELTSNDEESNFHESRNLCRKWLKDLRCEVKYTDVYKTNFTSYTKTLNWFGRNL